MYAGLPGARPIHWLLLTFLLLGGGFLRYAYLQGTEVVAPGEAGDAGYYLRYAGNLMQHGVFSKDNTQIPPTPDAYWAPGYPLFLATLISSAERAGADSYLVVRGAQIVLGTAAIALTFALALSCVPPGWALLAAVLVALSPHLISTEQYLLSETLTLFLLLASLLLFVRGMLRASAALQLGAGVGFALTYMTNPVTLFIAPVALGITWFAGRGREADCPRVSRRSAALIICPLLLTLSLWAVRGAVSVPPEAPDAGSRLLVNLVQGMHPDFHARWRANPRDPENPATLDMHFVDGSYVRFFERLNEEFSAQPARMLQWYLLEKPLLLWDWDIRVGAGDIYTYPVFYSLYQTTRPALATYVAMRSLHHWLFGFAVLSMVFLLRRDNAQHWAPLLLYACLSYVSAVYVVAQSEPRYSFPLRPEMYIMATFFLWQLWRRYCDYRASYRDRTRRAASAIQR